MVHHLKSALTATPEKAAHYIATSWDRRHDPWMGLGIQLPNCPEFLTASLGILTMGAVPAMHPMPYRRKELQPLLAHGQAKGIVCLAGFEGYDIATVMEE